MRCIISKERCTKKCEALSPCLEYIMKKVMNILFIELHLTEGEVHCER